jgi:hypothetical protein
LEKACTNIGLPSSSKSPQPPKRPPMVPSMPGAPPEGTSTSAVMLYDLLFVSGGVPSGMRIMPG